ncbi:MAG TPA: hypothetical protein VHG52_08085 [Thermomicrobiales bacterium]|nr:hypothetical protein [Thermomicrobiales bacterium]
MAALDQNLDKQDLAEKLLTTGAKAEQVLLKSERKAKKRLEDAMGALARDEARLRRAQERLERSRETVAAAAEALRDAQARRADGPT